MSARTVSSPRRAVPRTAAARRAAPGPRRVSGPTTGRARPATAPQHRTVGARTVGARTFALVRSLPDRSLIDRLVRGRAWIPVLGVLLAGLVTMQVEILKLGNRLGRSIERTSVLQSQNDSLQAGIATLADDQRIERLATGMGMVLPSPSLLTFIGVHPQHQLGRALGNIHAPDPMGFASQLAAQAATAALIAPATSSGTSSASQTSSGQTTTGAGGTTTSTSAGSVGSTGTATTPTQTGVAGVGAAGTTTTTGTTGTTTSAGTTTSTTSTPTPAAATGTTDTGGAASLPSTTQSGGPSGG